MTHTRSRLARLSLTFATVATPFVATAQRPLTMAKLNEKAGMGKVRILTDFSAEQYWALVAEFEVPDLKAFEDMMSGKGPQMSADDQKAMEKVFEGYHDLLVRGRREIWKIEG